ncbi:MAG: hypothetical protein M1547_12475 [Gammaproteobacteria bacterium]|nr:hypothetical protein [Gammaproteobacteria bacterium]
MNKSSTLSAMIGVIGGVLGALMGAFVAQRMNASTEADKVIRPKLEEAYYRVLNVSALADEVHRAALWDSNATNYEQAAWHYNSSIEHYHQEIMRVEAITNLYESKLGQSVQQLVECSKRFSSGAGDHFLVRAKNAGKTVVLGNPNLTDETPASLNALVQLKVACNTEGSNLKRSIASIMKEHL